MNLRYKTIFYFISIQSILAGLLFALPAQAIKIQSAKDNQVLILLEETDAKIGDLFVASDETGKKKALLEIKQVKNGRALAQVTKGALSASPQNDNLQAYKEKTSSEAQKIPKDAAPLGTWGVLAGFAQNNMMVKISDATSVKMSGSSYNLEGFYEKVLEGKISIMGRAGYDNLKASGSTATNSCTGTTNCSVDIAYLGFEGLLRYNVSTSRSTLWLGGGLGFLLALSKNSNVIDTSKISTNQKIILGGGIDWNLSNRTFIPFQIEYALYPNNSTVTTNQIILRLGYGMRF